MLTDNIKSGQYNNPKVATTVIGGTIYDKNKRVLAMDVPKYDVYVDNSYNDPALLAQILSLYLNLTPDEILNKLEKEEDSLILLEENLSEQNLQNLSKAITENSLEAFVFIKKSYSRTYPAQFHASQLINLIEKTYQDLLFPQAEYNVSTTYGKDIVLTIDLDVQYLLDLAVQNVYQLQSPEYVVAQLVDLNTNQVVALSYYPFFDLNQSSNQNAQATLVGSLTYQGTKASNLQVIQTVLEHTTASEITEIVAGINNSGLYTSNKTIVSMAENLDGTTSTISLIGTENKAKYLLFIGSYEAKYYTSSSVLDDVIEELTEGLNSQNKL